MRPQPPTQCLGHDYVIFYIEYLNQFTNREIGHSRSPYVSCHDCTTRQIASRRIAIFGHIARLSEEVPAHQALYAHVDLSLCHLPGRDWKRRPGRPNNIDQVRNDTGNMPSTLWRSAILRGHGTGVTQRPSLATRTWWWLGGVFLQKKQKGPVIMVHSVGLCIAAVAVIKLSKASIATYFGMCGVV